MNGHCYLIVGKVSQKYTLFKNGPSSGSFFVFLSFQTNMTILTTNICKNVITIQYMAPGFEPTTFETLVSSQNH